MSLIQTPYQVRRAAKWEFLLFLLAYLRLLGARAEAMENQLDPNAPLVHFKEFEKLGIGTYVLSWMQFNKHTLHRDSVSGKPIESVILTETSAFSLTETGVVFAEQFFCDVLFPEREEVLQAAWDRLLLCDLLPHYDTRNRMFRWGAHVLKHFRQPAANQELILTAAQELGWPDWLDDPLPKTKGLDAKVRLHDTIKDLNRRQTPYLVQFKGDGTGTRIGMGFRNAPE